LSSRILKDLYWRTGEFDASVARNESPSSLPPTTALTHQEFSPVEQGFRVEKIGRLKDVRDFYHS
jgi:hypothetical protein